MKRKLGGKKKAKIKGSRTKTMEADMEEEPEPKQTVKQKKAGTFCDVCDKKLRSRYHLKMHMAVHTGEKNYVCGICKKGYQQKWNLVTHVARVHSKEKPFKCNECDKAFGYSSHFKRHVKTHFLEKIQAPDTVKKRILNPHKCPHCEKSFESNYRLDLHVRIHTGNRPFVCDKCGKRFTNKRLCAIHMQKRHWENDSESLQNDQTFETQTKNDCQLTDSPEKGLPLPKEENKYLSQKEVIPCEVCGKTITRRSVKKHLNIHYRNRVYECRYCKKEFLESGQRMVHERKHTGEKPYICDICGRGHTQYGNLLTHRKRYHNLTGKSQRLWKRNDPQKTTSADSTQTKELQLTTDNLKEPEVHSSIEKDSMEGKELTESEPNNYTKPKCTGNETIEEFLKIASTWVNKKFQESKNVSPKKKNSINECFLTNSKEETLDIEDSLSKEAESLDANEGEKEETILEENKVVSLQQLKRRINKIIYEKVVEDLRQSPIKHKVLQVTEKIENSVKDNMDFLREFIKQMKTVPDNAVMRTEEGKLFWHCWLCESKLKSRYLLARHLIIHEPEENRPYKCDVCQKTFTQSNNFKEHFMSHTNKNQYYCEKCGSGFRHKSHFNVHMRRHNPTTAKPLPKKYECSYCGKKVHTNYQKIEHERTHTRERPYLCKICGQQFGASSTLNRHQSTHSDASHQCGVCLKFFRQKSSLKRHLEIHSQFPYSRFNCECGKTFTQSPSLKKHKLICKNRVEPVVKPFGCLICSKRFLTKSDLKRHIATHDSSKRFRCSVCLTFLKTDETFKRHMRRHDEILQDKPVTTNPSSDTTKDELIIPDLE